MIAGDLPPGLTLDAAEGEILGTCGEHTGLYPFTIQVADSGGQIATGALTLEVAERPTHWYEDEKIGGLVHGTYASPPPYIHGDPTVQAQAMALEGYAWSGQTTGYWPGKNEWPGWYNQSYAYLTEFGFHKHPEYKTAYEAKAVRYGSYLNLCDVKAMTYPATNPDFSTWPRYLDFMHRYLEAWLKDSDPKIIYLDGAFITAPIENVDYTDPRNTGWDYDALFSIAKTVSPRVLMLANCGGNPRLDWRVGDCDVFSTEGNNDGYDPYWTRWPEGRSGHNPKPIPNESWRYPFNMSKWGNYTDWREWTRVMVSMIGEGYLCNFDHSFDDTDGRQAMHDQMGQWLPDRLTALKGTRPSSLPGAAWGYSVVKDRSVFLHLLRNNRGKTGIPASRKVILTSFTLPLATRQGHPGGPGYSFRASESRYGSGPERRHDGHG